MISQRVWRHTFGLRVNNPVVVESYQSLLTSDTGLLPVRELDRTDATVRGSSAFWRTMKTRMIMMRFSVIRSSG